MRRKRLGGRRKKRLNYAKRNERKEEKEYGKRLTSIKELPSDIKTRTCEIVHIFSVFEPQYECLEIRD